MKLRVACLLISMPATRAVPPPMALHDGFQLGKIAGDIGKGGGLTAVRQVATQQEGVVIEQIGVDIGEDALRARTKSALTLLSRTPPASPMRRRP